MSVTLEALEAEGLHTCRQPNAQDRRCLTRVFPYAILYTIEPDFLLIVAVMHCSREPNYWRQQVEKR